MRLTKKEQRIAKRLRVVLRWDYQRDVAKYLGVSQPTISQWSNETKPIIEKYHAVITHMSNMPWCKSKGLFK